MAALDLSKDGEQTALELGWWPIHLRLTSRDQQVLRWVDDHLWTVGSILEPGTISHTVEALLDPTYLDEVCSAVARSVVELFEPYPQDVWAAGRYGSDRAWIRWDREAASSDRAALIATGPRQWRVVAACSVNLQDAVLRIVRELLRTEMALMGAFTLHASCAVAADGAGVLLCGGSGAGKTTLALGMAQTGFLVSGDQTELLSDDAGHLMAAGFPWSLRVGWGTLRAMMFDPAAGPTLLRSVHEGVYVKSATDDKLEFTFREAQSLLGCSVVSAASVRCIAAVQAVKGLPAPSASIVATSEGLELLRPHSREPDPSFGPFWLPVGDRRPTDPQRLDILADMATMVPVVDLRWSPGSHSVADTLSTLFDALLNHEGEA